ncbi:MAG TPA: TonB-dependent receptor [Bryobacteraceae bacterium]
MKFWKAHLGFLLALMFSLPAAAQLTSGNITGTVYDQSGATIPGATVLAKNLATGVTNTTETTSAGAYHFENLPIGNYSVLVTAGGFNKSEVSGVNVQLNQTVTANATLTLGQASTTVEVTEAAVAIDTTTAQVQNSYSAKQLADLPSASGGQANSGVINLSLLNPGVTSSGGSGYGTGPSVGGQRPTNNSFTIEGIDNNSLAVTGPIVTVPNDAVSEFSVLQNQFSPDFGHSSGGQFNQIVKSGTNEFHGAAFEYFQNKNLNAADNLNAVLGAPLHSRYDNNRFGGNLGGPIKRNKLFFFGDYEYNPVGGVNSLAYFAPTAAGYSSLSTIPGVSANNLAQFQKYLGTASSVADVSALPNGEAVKVGGTTIPVGMISSALPSYTNNEFGVGSLDYNISDKDSLRGRFILNRTGSIDVTGYPAAFFGVNPTNAYLATLSEYHTFTPTLLNEFRLGYNRLNQNIPVHGNESFPGLDQFPNINVFELNAAYGPDPNAPQYTIQNLYQLTDNVSWTKGEHNFKFGFDGWSAISPSSFTQRARGDYEWTTLEGYLFDTVPDGIAQRGLGNVTYYQNQQLYGFYANDNWKIRPNLTVNLGLRYEYLTLPLTENTQSLNASASVPGLIDFRSPRTQGTNFMPRVGLAYSPGTSGKTSIRAGFGLTYDVLYDNLGTLSLPPQLSATLDVTGTSGSNFLGSGAIPPSASVAPPQGAEARALTSGWIPDQKRPEAITWNFGIQHQFANNYVFETRYLGTRGLFLPIQNQINVQGIVNASNALPLFYSMPSAATLNGLTNTLTTLQNALDNGGNIVPAWANGGFTNPITAFMPQGNSTYHGWSNQLSRRFANGLQFQGSYTWSHNIDDSTDALNSTVLAPRRPQDFQNLRSERASSLLDYRHRVVLQAMYDVPYFKNRNWFMKNLVGNWEVVPVYIYQSGQHVTTQSAVDSNLNGDSAPDRVIINGSGNANLGSATTALTNSAGDVVGYLVNDPTARYIAAPRGTLADAGRSLLSLNPINNIDLTLLKRFSLTERFHLEVSARATNIFNHAQYTGGYLNDAGAFGAPTGGGGYAAGSALGQLARNTITPGTTVFQQWSQGFSSNPRQITLALKLTF